MLIDKTLAEYTNQLASDMPTPGGGSSLALVGLNATCLLMMAANVTITKLAKKDATCTPLVDAVAMLEPIKQEFATLVDNDAQAFQQILGAMKMPKTTDEEKSIDYLVILSGPEPQRTILEDIILKQAKDTNETIVILRAKPNEETSLDNVPDNVTTFNHVDDEKFAELVAKSKKIICRGGYSSLMDLITLNRNAYLVPTPGQTEQEYLAEYLTKEGLFNYCKQKDFKLKNINIPDIEIKRYFDSDC